MESLLLRDFLWGLHVQVIFYLRWIPKVLEVVKQVSSLLLGWTSHVLQHCYFWSLSWTPNLVAAALGYTLGDVALCKPVPPLWCSSLEILATSSTLTLVFASSFW